MDSQFEWKDEFKIGVEVIDKEHQKLFKIINKLLAFKEDEATRQWACREGIKFFKKHAVSHFADEEAYMDSINYEGLEQHRHLHKGFRENTLPALEQEMEQSAYSPDSVEHFLGVCAGWLIGHTLTEDMAITGKQRKKQSNLMPSENLTAMKKVIKQLLFDMFQLESHLVSDAYNGEKFGNGVYYRLIYGTPKNEKKQEVILVFEENLLINTVGKIIGIKTNKLDNMLVHAARYTARQFVKRVMEQFPTEDTYELKTENLLAYDQFEKAFTKENPHLSLLFNTGSGYFAYCATAPHLLESNIGTPIEADNAMDEVKEYLKKRETASTKPRVLVVDDSMTVRQHMGKLLSEDYDITLAESSIAAIRCITLNKPDLVLLDYEMPVCDGRQTLEMIRSDQALADIPVIFLTGRSDPESVQKVKSLKPAGYLLKNLEPAAIKENIDAFFEKKKQ